jgi:hypothetical protein
MMKTTKLLIATAFSLVIFMSASSIAGPCRNATGDEIKTAAKNQVSISENSISRIITTAEIEFSYLRFDVEKFVKENEVAGLPATSTEYLRFDVNKFSTSENTLTELPVTEEFIKLRFDVNDFTGNESSQITEMPENEFKFLRFDVTKYADQNTPEID